MHILNYMRTRGRFDVDAFDYSVLSQLHEEAAFYCLSQLEHQIRAAMKEHAKKRKAIEKRQDRIYEALVHEDKDGTTWGIAEVLFNTQEVLQEGVDGLAEVKETLRETLLSSDGGYGVAETLREALLTTDGVSVADICEGISERI